MKLFRIILLGFLLIGCTKNIPVSVKKANTLFTKITSQESNVIFKNQYKETLYFNFINYPYIYNGGGVSVGDLNNDGLEDIYFTSNQNTNKLYLNKGNFQFEDITVKAKVEDAEGWTTGVTMVDINNDGWLDIYVCKSGSLKSTKNRQNKLFVNQKNNTFKEEAKKYGLHDPGFSTQAYFFDFDLDNDLDMYLVNHRPDFRNNAIIDIASQKNIIKEGSDQLYRNDGLKYTNITKQAGIANKAWGLSAAIGDFNQDGYPDVFVANDFLQPDFLYINNKNGTFTDKSLTYFDHISSNSMGSDFADINNDLLPDLVVLDMMAADHKRSKKNMASMSTDNFNELVNLGYHHQYMSNVLQLNRGEKTFSEIGQLAGISKTDWSWAPLIADFDNDGFKDLFITNGIENDLSNQDFRNQMKSNIIRKKKVSLQEAINMMPSAKLHNYLFLNNKNHTFKDVSIKAGFKEKINSNGAAYADLDNDGDLDLVVNNQSDLASIYQNNSQQNYVKIKLNGPEKNKFGVGSTVSVFTQKNNQTKEVYISRGFQSSVSTSLLFGLGVSKKIDSIKIVWNDKLQKTVYNLDVNNTITLKHENALEQTDKKPQKSQFQNSIPENLGIYFKQYEKPFNDYSLQLLLPQKQSTQSKAIAVADVNNDGLDDLFLGNGFGEPAQLYLQNKKGTFSKSNNFVFKTDAKYEDQNALFFDADGDKDLDLYVTSGGYELPVNSTLLQDRLYLNNGQGTFSKGKLPTMKSSTKSISVADIDGDQDLDVFVGGRVIPGQYPKAPTSYLLENHKGHFKIITPEKAPKIEQFGMINKTIFSDFDKDGDQDLIVAAEWKSITVFENNNGNFTLKPIPKLDSLKGWFQTIKAIDFDSDGDEDYFVGNFGKNNKFHPSTEKPLHIYADYFDTNKSYDIILSKSLNGNLVPVRGKECSTEQTPFLGKKIATFDQFANATLDQIYGKKQLEKALHLTANTFDSFYIENLGNNTFNIKTLPNEAQFGPTLDFVFSDFNKDGKTDVLGVGNIYEAEVETIRYDASKGYVLRYENSIFKSVPNKHLPYIKNAKAVAKIKIKGIVHFIVLNNNAELSMYSIK